MSIDETNKWKRNSNFRLNQFIDYDPYSEKSEARQKKERADKERLKKFIHKDYVYGIGTIEPRKIEPNEEFDRMMEESAVKSPITRNYLESPTIEEILGIKD